MLVEIALEPFSNSHALDRFEAATAKLGLHNFYNEYLEITRLRGTDEASVKEKLRLFSEIWNDASLTATDNPIKLKSAHFKVKTELTYYLNPAFLLGAIKRTGSLVRSGKTVEALHYLRNMLLDMIESYLWLKTSIDKAQTDSSLLMKSLEKLERKNPKNYERLVCFLDLRNIGRLDAMSTIARVRKTMFKIRGDRKILIKNNFIRS